MKVGDPVRLLPLDHCTSVWDRVGLVLDFSEDLVLVFWGEDFPYEKEYHCQLEVISESK